MTESTEKVQENRVRRLAERQYLQLRKANSMAGPTYWVERYGTLRFPTELSIRERRRKRYPVGRPLAEVEAWLVRYEAEGPGSGRLAKDIALDEARHAIDAVAGVWEQLDTRMGDWIEAVANAREAGVTAKELTDLVVEYQEAGWQDQPDYVRADPLSESLMDAIEQ